MEFFLHSSVATNYFGLSDKFWNRLWSVVLVQLFEFHKCYDKSCFGKKK